MSAAPSRTGRHIHMRPVVRPVPRPVDMSGASAW
ncbi:MAG: hypothetical protein QOH46_959 [Solirubrobacteraceae bacterium]|jgi:hypothetical protein|nr:hypothetical protein [Solirubrobacteraceae bacterium]